MKVFAIVLLFAVATYAAETAKAPPTSLRSYGNGGGGGGSSYGSAPAPAYGGGGGGGSSYGGGSSAPASMPAPPCPKNYILSCQPSLQVAPCSSSGGSPGPSSSGYGSAGAYSYNYPSYALPYLEVNRNGFVY